jgi:hypothetical protein
MTLVKTNLKKQIFPSSRLKEIALFLFSLSGCMAVWGISNYLISHGHTPNLTIGALEQTVLGAILFVSFLWGHALGLSIQSSWGFKNQSRDYEQYARSLCLRILAAMIGMILAIFSADLVWSSGASLVSIMSLLGTQFRSNKA